VARLILETELESLLASLNQTIKTIKVSGAPAGVASGHHNNKIYVTTPENGSFVIINSQTQAVVKTVYIGGAPLGIAIDHKDNYVYIADWYSNKVHVFDAKQQQLVDTILVGQSPSGLVLMPSGLSPTSMLAIYFLFFVSITPTYESP
jgi:YVTN family beta-propeller protein